MTKKAKQNRNENGIQEIMLHFDTVEICLEGMQFHMQGAKGVTVHDGNGKIVDTYENRVPIKGKNNSHAINARTMNSGKLLVIEGSPVASRYGQNLYTSSDLLRSCNLAIKRTLKFFGIKPPADLLNKWLQGDVELLRADIVVNYRLQSESEVLDVLKQIRRQLESQRGTTKTNDTSVYWAPKNGTEYSIGFYAKGPQLRRSQKYADLPEREMLIDESENILRVEIRLRGKALSDLKLNKVGAWKHDTAETVFKQYMSRLNMLSVTSGPLTEEDLSKVGHRMRPVLALHKTGGYIAGVYSVRSRQRHVSYFRKHGINLTGSQYYRLSGSADSCPHYQAR